MTGPSILVRNLHHAYQGREVLRGVDLDLYPGEIHALVGDRQAGKSTLAHVLSGDVRKQTGQIFMDGKEVPFFTPRIALRNKIGILYQNPTVSPSLTFVDNVYLGALPFFITPRQRRKMEEACRETLEHFGLSFDIRVPLASLSESDQQIVELLRLVLLDMNVLLLDEVSNRRTPAQMKTVFQILDHLRKIGRSILYITSNVDEVLPWADRVTVLKDGLRRSTDQAKDMSRLKILSLAYSFALNRDDGTPRELPLNRINEELLRSLPTGVILLDAGGLVVLANSVIETLADRGQGTLRGRSLNRVFEDIGVELPPDLTDAPAFRQSRTWNDLRGASGRSLRIKMAPLWDSEEFQGTLLFIDDITLDSQIQEYLSRADQVASIAELAAGVAHEINNPLAVLQNYLYLTRSTQSESERLENLDRMNSELQRIVEIVQSLLSFSRVSQSARRPTDLTVLLEEVLVLLAHKLSEKEITVSRKGVTESLIAYVVENKIKQLFLNLVTNAVEAVLRQGTITIEIEADMGCHYGEVRITDNGCGVAPEIRDRIFQPFFTTKVSKTNTGLGLSICQHIVEFHGGVLFLESVPGNTTFTVRIPLTKVEF